MTAQVNVLFSGLITIPELYYPRVDILVNNPTNIEYIVVWGVNQQNLKSLTVKSMPTECLAFPPAGVISLGSSVISSPQQFTVVNGSTNTTALSFSNFTYS